MTTFASIPPELLINVMMHSGNLPDLSAIASASSRTYALFQQHWRHILNHVINHQSSRDIKMLICCLVRSNDDYKDMPRLDNFGDSIRWLRSNDLSTPYTSLVKTARQLKGIDEIVQDCLEKHLEWTKRGVTALEQEWIEKMQPHIDPERLEPNRLRRGDYPFSASERTRVRRPLLRAKILHNQLTHGERWKKSTQSNIRTAWINHCLSYPSWHREEIQTVCDYLKYQAERSTWSGASFISRNSLAATSVLPTQELPMDPKRFGKEILQHYINLADNSSDPTDWPPTGWYFCLGLAAGLYNHGMNARPQFPLNSMYRHIGTSLWDRERLVKLDMIATYWPWDFPIDGLVTPPSAHVPFADDHAELVLTADLPVHRYPSLLWEVIPDRSSHLHTELDNTFSKMGL